MYFFAIKNCCPEDDRAANIKNLVQLIEYHSDIVACSTNNVSCFLLMHPFAKKDMHYRLVSL